MIELKAKRDKKDNSTKYDHYIIGKVGADICGGLYVKRDIVTPEEVSIILIKGKEDE
jgi:hypothetical protein